MTTTCDLNVDWNKCPNCVRLKERIKDAEQAAKVVSANLDRAYAGYREDVAAGRACPATPRQRAWSSYLDDLEMEQSMASSHWKEAIDTWAASINEHHRCYEARQQEVEGGELAETEQMVTICKDEAVDALVNIYGGHIDEWLEALRERTIPQPAEPTPQERAEYFTERDQCDQADGEREKSREAARRVIADYMGVNTDGVRIICSVVSGGGR